ncbi:MAG: tRNA guanosine(34) transglycosylase Tgt [Patescibacteria group bacterium]
MLTKNPFKFTIKSKSKTGYSRTGVLQTPHGQIHTPVFMPVGTLGAVKTLSPDEVKSLGAEIILANTYHLHLRPGEKFIKKMGGLHEWTNWDRPMLTDSGGFQVFSLENMRKITQEGVEFKSHIDGTKLFLTPEKVMQIEHDLGADIIMAFDECAAGDSSHAYAKEAMQRTHDWVLRCKKEHEKLEKKRGTTTSPQALFPIIQGVTFADLRIESTKFMSDLNLPGIAIGGLSVGEEKEKMYGTLETIAPHLPEEKPRYLMGVGSPEDLLEGVDRGIDMFDCVMPTRIARHGAFWTQHGRNQIKNAEFRTSSQPLMKNCQCYSCKNFSASYIRHLFVENEILAHRLITIHNLAFLLDLMKNIRTEIEKGTFQTFKKKFLKKFLNPTS